MIIAVDFDGTCVTHEYPQIGKDIGAVPFLTKLVERGDQLILWTMRSGKELDMAINCFTENNLPLYGIQTNPTQHSWTESPKAYAQTYIDDASLGCPLTYNPDYSDRPYVDWIMVGDILDIDVEKLIRDNEI